MRWVTACVVAGTILVAAPAGAEDSRESTTVPESVRKVVVNIASGSVTVRTGRVTTVEVDKSWSRPEPEPEVVVEVQDGVLHVTARCAGLTDSPVEVGINTCTTDAVITLGSAQAQTQIDTSGDIVVQGLRGSHDLASSLGDITVAGTEGASLDATTRGGNVAIRDVRSQTLAVQTGSGTVSLQRAAIEGFVVLGSDGGDMALTDITADSLATASGSGDVSAASVRTTRELSLDSNGGALSVTGSSARGLILDSGAAHALVRDSRARSVVATTTGGAVDLRRVAADAYTVATGPGNVILTTTSAPSSVIVETNGGDVVTAVPRGSYALVWDTNGDVRLDGVTPDRASPRRLDISSGSGDIIVLGR